jgi:hypothetical protein
MKITPTEIKNYEIAARRYLAEYGIESDELKFDHFGLQTLSSEEYKDLKNYFIERERFEGEVHFHGRRLGKFLLGEETQDKLELIEPHYGEVFVQLDCFVEHVAFKVSDLKKYKGVFADRILSKFNFAKSKGFKIQGPGQLLIEFINSEY